MKYLLAFILLFSFNVKAEDSLELVGPGITWHVIDNGASDLYSHQLSHDGRLIYTPELGIKKIHYSPDDTYHSLALFTADNSIGEPVYGALGGAGVRIFKMLDLGVVFGGYIQNNNDFLAQGITPFSMTPGSNAFVPLIGVEINTKFKVNDHWFVGWNNLLTPIITNSNLSLGYAWK